MVVLSVDGSFGQKRTLCYTGSDLINFKIKACLNDVTILDDVPKEDEKVFKSVLRHR